MRVTTAAECRTMAWKNGGGSTTEIAVFPANAGLDDFDWRVSTAEIRADGPFSMFPGIDRSLAILEGAGITLNVEGRDPAELSRGSAPHSFPADRPTAATLLDGPVRDLNVMSRRGRFRHRLTRFVLADRVEVDARSPSILIFCQTGSLSIAAVGDIFKLRAGDTLCATETVPGTWRIMESETATFFLIELAQDADG